MDAIRRGAMMKMGRLLAGGAGAVAALGRGRMAEAMSGQMESALSTKHYTNYPDAAGTPTSIGINPPSPMDRARHKAAEPLYRKMEELRGYRRFAPREYYQLVEVDPHFSAMRSTSRHWRACVASEQDKARQSVIDQLEQQIRGILRNPIESLEQTFQEAVASFMEEFNKP